MVLSPFVRPSIAVQQKLARPVVLNAVWEKSILIAWKPDCRIGSRSSPHRAKESAVPLRSHSQPKVQSLLSAHAMLVYSTRSQRKHEPCTASKSIPIPL